MIRIGVKIWIYVFVILLVTVLLTHVYVWRNVVLIDEFMDQESRRGVRAVSGKFVFTSQLPQ